MFQITNIVVILFVTTVINACATYMSWRRSKDKGGFLFTLGMLAVTIWTLAAGLDYAAVPIPTKVLFSKIEYLGFNLALACFVIFVLFFTGNEEWLEKAWVRALFGIIPALNILLAWTNEWHGWLWTGFSRGMGENIIIYHHGPGYTWVVLTGYAMITIMIVLLWTASRRGPEFSRRQARLLFAASTVPVIGNLAYMLQPPELKGVDWTSITFSVSGVLFVLALYGTRLLDIVPIARDKLVSSLSDGMIVLDMQDRIIDANQAAARMINSLPDILIGKSLHEVDLLPNSFSLRSPEQTIKRELVVDTDKRQYYDVALSPLRDHNGTLLGRLIIFRDITIRKENELRLLKLTQAVTQSPASVLITDLKGNIEYVNPYFSAHTGYSYDEVIGKSTNIQKSGQTPREVYDDMWKTIQAGQTWRGEFLNRKKSGALYWEEAVIAPVMDQDGHVINYLAVKVDITKRKIIEGALRTANQQLESQLKEIEGLQSSLREQAIRDPLTHLHNRRFLNESIEQEFHHAKRTSEYLSIILIDIDNFKTINDTYGHMTGDSCLIALANLLQQHVRRSDILCRYGGEEFILVLPATNLEGATQHAEKIRRLVEDQVVELDGQQIRFTISLGVSVYPVHGDSYKVTLNKADDALYASKRAGRNRVTVWSGEVTR